MRFAFAFGAILLAAPAFAETAQTPPVVVQQIFSSDKTAAGQPINLPPGDVTVSVSTYTIAPGAKLPVHEHPFPRYAYVLAGTIAVTDAETGKTTTYRPGEVIIEMIGRWHSGENVGPDPVELLVFDQAPKGAQTTILKPN